MVPRSRGIVRQHLADDEDFVAPARDRFGDDFLGAAVAIHLGGVDQGHAEIDAEPQRRDLLVALPAVLAHVPGALAERRNGLAVRQPDGRYRGRRRWQSSSKTASAARAIATGRGDAKGSDDLGRQPRHRLGDRARPASLARLPCSRSACASLPEIAAGRLLGAVGDVLVCRYEARDRRAARAFVDETVAWSGRLDALVNNAGTRPSSASRTARRALDDLFEINVKAPFRVLRAAMPHLKESAAAASSTSPRCPASA